MNIPRQNGIDIRFPMIQTQAIAMGLLAEYLSLIIPPMTDEQNPRTLKLRALAEANSVFIIGKTD